MEKTFNPNEHLMNLKGKQYLQVMWRLVWFREEKPLWSIDTKLEQLTDNHAVFSAKISDETGIQKASGYGSESVKDFRDFIEKAETKAIGRALAMLGYGTQFAPELDEEERIVDSPVERKKKPPEAEMEEFNRNYKEQVDKYTCQDCGKLIEPREFNGKLYTVEQISGGAMKKFKAPLCWDCMNKRKANESAAT